MKGAKDMDTTLPHEAEQHSLKPSAEIHQPAQSISFYKEQIQLLNQVVDKQIKQDRAMDELKAQNSELLKILSSVTNNLVGHPDGLAHVKIENVNMPFWAMVGLMLKWTFASIPAIIVIFILSLILLVIVAMIGVLPLLLDYSQFGF